ncbi:MAG: kelch motif-containing protein [Thermoplasmata archaeon]|nr:kelch motif-containing protein [Thermoplasmata archaeon]
MPASTPTFGARRPSGTHLLGLVAVALATIELLSLCSGATAFGMPAHPSPAGVVSTSRVNQGSEGADQIAAAQRSLTSGSAPVPSAAGACRVDLEPVPMRSCPSSLAPAPLLSNSPVMKPSWSPFVNPVPSNREGSGFVYDARDKYVLLFGGFTGLAYLNDTWKYAGGAWYLLHPTKSPGTRAFAGIAFDAADNYVVLYGGATGNASSAHAIGDSWSYAGGVWKVLAPTMSPGPLAGPMMTYDAKDGRVVLFGGGNSTYVPKNATWEFLAGQWTKLTPHPAPSIRDIGEMSYDANDGTVVLFGGYTGNSSKPLLTDTWNFTGGKWTKLSVATSPPGVIYAGFAYSPLDAKLVLFGGADSALTLASISQTWTFSAGAWTKIGPPGHPSSRNDAGMADGTRTSGIVLFGGDTSSFAELNDTWTFQTLVWTHALPRTPVSRLIPALTWDGADGYVLLFGGTSPATSNVLGDTWKFSGSVWTPLHPATSPSPRTAATMAYDASDGYVVLFGGANSSGQLGDTWTYAAGVWSPVLTSGGPAKRAAATMTYDYADGYVVLFGGANATSELSDTWSFSAGVWSTEATGGAAHPSARQLSVMAYDSADGYTVLFSGSLQTGGLYPDTWTYLAGTWTNVSLGLAPTPPGLVAATMTDDTFDGYLLLFGGDTSLGPTNATWSFTNGTWTHLQPALNPGADYYTGSAYDPNLNGVVLFGGISGTRTWLY